MQLVMQDELRAGAEIAGARHCSSDAALHAVVL